MKRNCMDDFEIARREELRATLPRGAIDIGIGLHFIAALGLASRDGAIPIIGKLLPSVMEDGFHILQLTRQETGEKIRVYATKSGNVVDFGVREDMADRDLLDLVEQREEAAKKDGSCP